MKKCINVLLQNAGSCKYIRSKNKLTIPQRVRPEQYCCRLMFSTSWSINHPISVSHYIWKTLNEESDTPPPHTHTHKTWKNALNAIENPKLSSVADFKRTAHSDCMFPSSGSGRGTKNLRKISLSSKRKLLVLSV